MKLFLILINACLVCFVFSSDLTNEQIKSLAKLDSKYLTELFEGKAVVQGTLIIRPIRKILLHHIRLRLL